MSTTATRLTLASLKADTDSRLDRIEGMLAELITARVEPKAKARTRKPQPKAAAKPVTSKALTKGTRVAFIAACEAEGYEVAGWSTWELAFWAVGLGYAPKGFHIGERYTDLALEAGA